MSKHSVEIKVYFRAGHRLISPYVGNCNNVHGEGYTVVLIFTSNFLDECGMVIDFKQIIHLHREILESFSTIPGELFGKDFDYYIDEMKHAYTSVHGLVLSNKELLSDLRETNDSLLSTKQNEHMKLFSILAFVTFPLMLFLNIFMLPTSHTPIIGYDYDWEILVGTVIVLAIGMFYFFKKKGWI